MSSLVTSAEGNCPAQLFGPRLAGCSKDSSSKSNQRKEKHFMPVTLSVNEISADLLSAFKVQTPEIFGPNGFVTDFKSDTARIGDTITSSIEKIPVTTQYDANNGGFKAGAQAVTSLFED